MQFLRTLLRGAEQWHHHQGTLLRLCLDLLFEAGAYREFECVGDALEEEQPDSELLKYMHHLRVLAHPGMSLVCDQRCMPNAASVRAAKEGVVQLGGLVGLARMLDNMSDHLSNVQGLLCQLQPAPKWAQQLEEHKAALITVLGAPTVLGSKE
jgi:hypothetical protein